MQRFHPTLGAGVEHGFVKSGQLYTTFNKIFATAIPSKQFYDQYDETTRSSSLESVTNFFCKHTVVYSSIERGTNVYSDRIAMVVAVVPGIICTLSNGMLDEFMGVEYKLLIGERVVWVSYRNDEGFLTDWALAE